MKDFHQLLKGCLLLSLITVIFVGCSTQSPNVQPTTNPPTSNPTSSSPPLLETIVLQDADKDIHETDKISDVMPNLWTKIDGEKIAFYPVNWLSDFAYDKDGSLWVVGGFGIIRQEASGQQTWYSIKKGLPVNFFSSVAVSPSGEVWAGGTDNTLLRFDSEQWIDEGIKLPPPFDMRTGWLCYSKDIIGIDFDQKGNAWVMNSGIEIYAQAYGQWVNFPFPKNILPIAGGGGCPLGIRVVSENDITIKRSGCCANGPIGYHFNGKEWTENADFSSVDNLLDSRHKANRQITRYSLVERSGYTNLPFDPSLLLPDYLMGYREHISLMTDKEGLIWLTDGVNLYNNENGKFKELAYNYAQSGPNIDNSLALNFGNEILYYEKGIRPVRLPWVLQNTFTGWYEGGYPTVDNQNRIWAYIPDKGLAVIEKGIPRILGNLENLTDDAKGGVLPLNDENAIVGSKSALWIFENGHWQKISMPSDGQLFTHISKNKQGTIYAATGTDVYEIQIQDRTFKSAKFVYQDAKPVVVSENGNLDGCGAFNKRYTIAANCPDVWGGAAKTHYFAKLLVVQEDGSVVYINNKIIAKLQNGKWKSFLLDTLEIKSATVDMNGFIWVYTGVNGLLRFDPDIFDSYQPLLFP